MVQIQFFDAFAPQIQVCFGMKMLRFEGVSVLILPHYRIVPKNWIKLTRCLYVVFYLVLTYIRHMDRAKLIAAYRRTKNIKGSADRTGYTYEKARRILLEEGLKKPKLKPGELKNICKTYDKGVSIRKIGTLFHKQHHEITILLRNNQNKYHRVFKGKDFLNPEIVLDICKDYHSRIPEKTIRLKYNIGAYLYRLALTTGKADPQKRQATYRCKHCGKMPPEVKFWKKRKLECRECNPHNPSSSKKAENAYLLKHFGITTADYDRLLKSQDSKCALCGVAQGVHKRKHAVDHCHNTGEIRGLLCTRCNTLLGSLEKAPWFIKAAKKYLTKPPARGLVHPIDDFGQGFLF